MLIVSWGEQGLQFRQEGDYGLLFSPMLCMVRIDGRFDEESYAIRVTNHRVVAAPGSNLIVTWIKPQEWTGEEYNLVVTSKKLEAPSPERLRGWEQLPHGCWVYHW